MNGVDYFLELLRQQGVRYLFGNPGHTELKMLDRLVDMPEMDYVLGLHEGAALTMADGYAMASGRLGVFCGHVMPGFGNAMGMLFNASKHGTPLLVTAGQQDLAFAQTEPFLWGDLARMARPLVKWAHEVQNVGELERVLTRAVKVALTPPTGPVFLSLPKDVMAAEGAFSLARPTVVAPRLCADREAIGEAAAALLAARSPLIIAGDEVGKSGAEPELRQLADLLGSRVYSECASTTFNFPIAHPLYQGALARTQKEVREVLDTADVIFAVGAEVFTLAAYARTEPLPPGVRLIQLSADAWQLGKNYRAEPAMLGDAKATLAALVEAVRARCGSDQSRIAADRALASERRKAELLAGVKRQAAADRQQRPLRGTVVMQEIVAHAPDDAVIVDESATTGMSLRRFMQERDLGYFGLKGGGLGWGLGASIGVHLALPERPVLCLVGDGAALFGIQALWTAANRRAKVTYVVCNNRQYRLIKHRLHLHGGGASARAKRYYGSELNDPPIDFVGLAQSFGIPAMQVESADDIADAMRAARDREGPSLIDVLVEGSYPEREEAAKVAAPATSS
ncbi:benzoylformate decarboxylase [Sulfurifustis variabilis]|uniref:Benzoylformate decarboxylase n=1 Tax=Sulfurifustis variabilis TaxID=1675686 RepID=A0A1B4VAC0_9GAMM|nr:thiamine pyrophosphate-binding protein [Sulfurifustis variabilis]BAU48564.1 benzoylformate decarboxylase [Sulfurifustis variabilis]